MGSFTYVEMECILDDWEPIGVRLESGWALKPLRAVNSDSLYRCYLKAFQAGDAQFFQRQDQGERRRYYQEELGFPVVLDTPASFAIFREGDLIGFSLVMPYPEGNYHISCMCITPEYQGRGLGSQMLDQIKSTTLENGIKTLTLGTEPEMKAFQLYQKAGFIVTADHIVAD